MGLRLNRGQISLNLVEIAFATRQLAFLATRIAFYALLAQACAEIWSPVSLGFSSFGILTSFPFLFAAVIDLLLGLLAVKKLLRKHHRGGQFLLEVRYR